MADIVAKLQAFVTHPEVDSMTPVWSLTQDDAREILAMINNLQALAGAVNPHTSISFDQIKEAARRNGADAL